jgi:hypothetical protein
MGVVSIPSTNVNLRADVRSASASAVLQVATTNVSLRTVVRDHLSPGDPSAPFNISTVDNISYRYLKVSMDTSAGGGGTISVTSPTSPSHYRWDASALTWTSDNAVTYAEANTGDYLALRGVSYSTYSVVSVKSLPDYGYIFDGWRWFNSSGVNQGLASTSAVYSLSSTAYTGAQYYELRAEFSQDESS